MEGIVYAGFWRRAGATLLDGVIVSIVNLLLTMLINLLPQTETVVATIINTTSLLIGIGYYIYFIGNRGQTPGKMIMKIKVQDIANGEILGYKRAISREVFGKFISGVVFGLGYLLMIRDKDKQTWHDKIAKSVVVKI